MNADPRDVASPRLSLSEVADRTFVETIIRGIRSALWKNVHTYSAGSSAPEYLLTVGIADAIAAATKDDGARIILECQEKRFLKILGYQFGTTCGYQSPNLSCGEIESADANGRFDIVVTQGAGHGSMQVRIVEVKDHVKQASEMFQQFKRMARTLQRPTTNGSEIQAGYFAFLVRASPEIMLGNLSQFVSETTGISLDIYPRPHSDECDGEGDTIYVLRVARYEPGSREAICIW